MRFFIVLFFTISIFQDFSTEVCANNLLSVSCDTTTDCIGTDSHENSQQATDSSAQSNDHCHCHVGHTHMAMFLQFIRPNISIPVKKDCQEFYPPLEHFCDSYFEITKPPIFSFFS